MADLTLTEIKGGSGISLGGTIMSVRNEIEFEENGQTYLQSGTIETDLTDIDSSLIKYGSYLSAEGRPNLTASSWQPANHAYVISDNGTHLQASSNNVYRSTDAGVTWSSNITANTTAIAKYGLATNGSGVWVNCSDAYIWSSTDDGLTWTQRVSATADLVSVHYSPVLDKFFIKEKGSGTSSGDSKIHVTSDGITFTNATVGGDTVEDVLSLPSVGRTEMFATARYGANSYYIKKSDDEGVTWSSWHINGQIFDISKPSAMWQWDGFLWILWDNAPSGNYFSISKHDVDAAIYAAPLETRAFMQISTRDSSIAKPVHSEQTGPNDEYFMANGYKIERDGFTITPTSAAVVSGTITSQHTYFRSDASRIIASPLINDTTTLFPPLVNVPCAGSITRYSEGSANQYTRIK